MPTLVMLFALLLVACGSAEPPACPLGRVEACACPGGSQGAQECGPLGVWSACVCLGGDAGNAVAVADATPDAVVDAPDVPQDATPEITAPDVIAVADVPQDVSADADPFDTRATSVSVIVRSSSLTWSTPRAQPTCTVTGGTLSLGADYDRPEHTSFTVLGPITGPVTLTGIAGGMGASDIRATASRGPMYLTDGAAVQRVNVTVRGTPWAGIAIELTALGCVVR